MLTRRPPGQSIETCIDRQRETTSGAFFLSPEFQYTGYYVYRVFKGALGRAPYLSEFLVDQAFVGNGIITPAGLSGAQVNQNKQAFASQFVLRPEFVARYTGLTNAQYVDRLFQTTGVTPSAADRQALIDQLNANPSQRGEVLFKVVDGINVISEGNQQFTTTYGQAFYNQQVNPAFVQMEYFGYMRRDPDGPGFAFWLGKLNSFPSYIEAEMVRVVYRLAGVSLSLWCALRHAWGGKAALQLWAATPAHGETLAGRAAVGSSRKLPTAAQRSRKEPGRLALCLTFRLK